MEETLYYSEEGDLVRSLGYNETIQAGDFRSLSSDKQNPTYDGKKIRLQDDDPDIGRLTQNTGYMRVFYRLVIHHDTFYLANKNLRPNLISEVKEQLEKGNITEVVNWLLIQTGNLDSSILMRHDKHFQAAIQYYLETMKFMHVKMLFENWIGTTIHHIERVPHDLPPHMLEDAETVKKWADKAFNSYRITEALSVAQKYIVLLENTLTNNRVKIPDENEICPGEDPLDVVVHALKTVGITGTDI